MTLNSPFHAYMKYAVIQNPLNWVTDLNSFEERTENEDTFWQKLLASF